MNALLFTMLSVVSATPTSPGLDVEGGLGDSYRPEIRVWLSREGYYHRGDRARVYFDTKSDAFVTILRIDTDGRVQILFPHDPWQDNYVYGERRYEVIDPHTSHGKHSFVVDEYPGQGYILAVASLDPFDYRAFTRQGRWDYRAIAHHGRVTGDPYVAFDELVDHILPLAAGDFTLDVYPYHVERRYAYPRFLCYDCHSHVAFTYWNPYRHSCVRFRLVIYDDPYYYPARVYAGTRVVYKRPVRYEPRYTFKDRVGNEPYITRERARPADRDGRRPVNERGATSRDRGSVARVPAGVPRTPVTTDERAGITRRRPVENGTTRVTDRAVSPRRAQQIDTPRPAERLRPRRLDDRNRDDERGAASPSARPQLERRKHEPSVSPPARVRETRERSEARPPSARSQEVAPKQQARSSKRAAPARRSATRAAPSPPGSKRRAEPNRTREPSASPPARARETRERSEARRPPSARSGEVAPKQQARSSKRLAPARGSATRAAPGRPASKPRPERKGKDPKR